MGKGNKHNITTWEAKQTRVTNNMRQLAYHFIGERCHNQGSPDRARSNAVHANAPGYKV